MKLTKVTSGTITAFFLVASLVSCKKENNVTANTPVTKPHPSPMSASRAGNQTLAQQIGGGRYSTMSLRKYYDRGPTDYGCDGEDGNCLPDVVITAPAVSQLFSLVSGTGNGAGINAFIQSNYEGLKQQIDAVALDGVVSGRYSLRARGSAEDHAYLLFTNKKDNNIELVYSFKK